MAESMNLVALDWVRGEIEETLNQTQEALEGYIENPEDVTRLQFCVTYLHQVVGSLKMIEAHGASLLSEEMESLAQAISDKTVSDEKDAIEVLLRAVLQMPQYLGRIFSGGRDMAVVLLPLLNDIRAAKGEALLSESSLFTPDIESGQQELAKSTIEKKEAFSTGTMRKIRQLYEISLLGIIKGEELDKNFRYMSLALTKLANMTVGTPSGTLWWISQALMDSLREHGLECTKAIKMLLGKLNKQMRSLLKKDSLEIDMPADLLKNILFYIAKSTASSPRIDSVRQAFRLADSVLSEEMVEEERGRLSGPDRAAITSVVTALLEQIEGIKETLDAFVIGKVDDVTMLTPVTDTLKQISDTLSVVGVTNIKQTITDQFTVLKNAITSGNVPDRNVMVEVAGGLLHAETTLKSLLHGGVDRLLQDGAPERLSEAQELVVKECRATLEAVKESFNTYVKSYLNVGCIEETPPQLREVMGALSVMEERRSAAILEQSCAYVEQELIQKKKKPEAKELEALADAISAVEYYLEQITSNGRGDPLLLEVGEERMQWIGYEVPGTVGAFGELKR